MGWRISLTAVVIVLALAGEAFDACDAHVDGGPSPQAAVELFLVPFGTEVRPGGFSATEEQKDLWASSCDQVDPRLRPVLRFEEDDEAKDQRLNCGSLVFNLVRYTGDTGEMDEPSRITGEPVSAETSGDTSIVTVDMHYGSPSYRSTARTAPPAKARIKVLVVKRDGAWWVATPQAFNPLYAAEGGFDEAELRQQHEQLLAGEEP